MSLLHKMAGGGGNAPTYVDDVFSAYTYTGNGSTQTITNGIDLSGKGGMVWIKRRDSAAYNHNLQDTSATGVTTYLASNNTAAKTAETTAITAFNSNGFTMGGSSQTNATGGTGVAFSIRKAAKFFDVVTFTAGSNANRRLSHSLGVAPGFVMVKATSTSGDWWCYHKDLGRSAYVRLNTTGASTSSSNMWGTSDPTSTDFGVGEPTLFVPGTVCVAYLFAHDTAADGLIQCGSFTTDGSGNATVSLGWEPQFVMIKKSSTTGDWGIGDASRGAAVDTNSPSLYANTSAAETNVSTTFRPNATGFSAVSGGASVTHIYLAIRRPNKPPTTGTEVYTAAVAAVSGGASGNLAFAPDLLINKRRGSTGLSAFTDRLRGIATNATGFPTLRAESTSAESSVTSEYYLYPNNNGYFLQGIATDAQVGYAFKRAPQVFDVVCYTSTTEAAAVTHGLTVAPEIVLIKSRSAGSWYAIHYGIDGYNPLTNVAFSTGLAPTYTPTSSNFKDINASTSQLRVAYLFATKAGISKVFSYTGNGSSQTINCGFSAGARFILIKRTDSTGDWYVWDTVRGVVAGNDPHLSLNTTAAEVTTNDSIDPDNSGFIVNQLAATNINVTSATYIGLAFA